MRNNSKENVLNETVFSSARLTFEFTIDYNTD